jgi:uncharacterized protein (DUF2147 family)
MVMRRSIFNVHFCGLAAIAAIASVSTSAVAAEATGIWVSDNGRGAIEIKHCGGKLCGHLVWVKDPADTSRGCRKQIIGDVAPAGDGRWDGGWVYSPERKRRYDVELKALADGTLRVVGYAGTKLFSKTMIWTKAPADLQRCDVEAVAVTPATEAPKVPSPTAVVASKTPEMIGVETKAKVPVVAAVTPPPSSKSPSEAIMRKPAEPLPQVATAPAPAPPLSGPTAPAKPNVSSNDDDDDDSANVPKEDLIEKIAGMEFGDGYGLKKTGNGNCRLKVPYVTITIPCEK